VKSDTKSKEQIEAFVTRLANDLPFFLDQLWRSVGLPPLAEHQRQMADWLQNGPRRRGVRAFRGAAKTWVTLGYCLWRLFRNKNDRILLVSKSERHSKDSLYMVRKWIGQVSFLQHMTPDRAAGQRDSALQFDVRQSDSDRTPSFTAASVTGQITGSRSTCIISDDVETNQSTLTLDSRTRLREEVKEYDNILIPGGDIIFLGTPHHEESLYDKLEESGYVFQSWPAQYPTVGNEPRDLAPGIKAALASGDASAGDSVWPERFSLDELIEREASEGRSTYAMQYLMLTHLGDDLRYPLKLSDVIVFPVQKEKAPLTIAWGTRNDHGGSTKMEELRSLGFGGDGYHAPIMFDKQWSYYTGTYMWIDPSGRGKDKTAYAIVSHLNGYLWVKAVGGWQGGYQKEVLEGLAYQAKIHDVRTVFVEENFGQGMFTALFEPILQAAFTEAGVSEEFPDGWKASLESVRVSGQKEIRLIGGLEPLFNQHRIVFHPDVAANEDLQRQITRITRDRNCLGHDDEVEALAMCCIQWQDVMNLDPDQSADRIRENFIKKQLGIHYAAYGLAKSETSWIKRRR
jgi:hypothetical protein